MTFVDRVSTNGKTEEVSMEPGVKIKWKDQESLNGQMVESMKEIIRMTRNTVKVHSSGQMVESMSVIGKQVNNMAQEYLQVQTEKQIMEDGLREKEMLGSKKKNTIN